MHILGIDIGGSAIKGALVDPKQGVLVTERMSISTPRPATPPAVADAVAQLARHFNWHGQIGCGLPAAVQNGVARTAANIDTAWIGCDARQLLAASTGSQVTVINDADAAGIAELHFGAGQDHQGTIIMVTVGTGLGTALFHNRSLVPNTELGHISLNGITAEKFASASVRNELGLSYAEWAKRFDLFLQRLQALFWPDLIIIGGEISKNHEQFLPGLSVATEIHPARLRNEAGIVGAALAAVSPQSG